MSDRVFAITSVYEDSGLLPHFLAHYTRLGVHRIVLVVRTPNRDGFEAARAWADSYPAAVHWSPTEFYAESDKGDVERGLLSEHRVEPDDYVMHLDLDEFQEYPVPLTEIVARMNQADDWALRGWIVDRVAEGGTLEPIRPEPSLGEQFPIGCDLTDKLLGAWTQKIMLCRGRVELQDGRHDTWNAYYDRIPVGRPEDYVVHHFKWTASVDRRLRDRLECAAIGLAYIRECRRFLDYFQDRGRIDLGNPTFRARWLGALIYPA